MLLPLTLALATALQSGGAGAPPDTVYFTPQVGQPTFAVREPVLRIVPGTVLISNTMFGDYYTEEGGAFPGDVGPIYIEGATTEDMLVVKILELRLNHDLAAARIYSNFGGLASDSRVRLLNDPIPERRYVWRLDRENMTATTQLPDSRMREVTIDLQPMLGRVAVAPPAGLSRRRLPLFRGRARSTGPRRAGGHRPRDLGGRRPGDRCDQRGGDRLAAHRRR